jgi:quercetin dioxygenase-like cupin family protein
MTSLTPAPTAARPFHRPAETGPAFWGPGDHYTFLVTGDESGGAYFAMEALVPPGGGPPPHIHTREDETFYVLEGELRIRAGNDDIRIGAGEAALAPMGVLHTYRVESHEGARWLNVTTHGDFERFVRALSRPAEHSELPAPQGPPTPEQADALAVAARQHGIELVGPPLEP